MHLSKDDILKAEDCRVQEVNVPEWGGIVLVRGMTGRQRDEFEASLLEPGRRGQSRVNPANLRAKIVARCVVDDEGQRLFTDGDAAALGEKSGAAIDRVYEVAAKLSGLSEKDAEEMTGNFGGASGGDSSSSSPTASTSRSGRS